MNANEPSKHDEPSKHIELSQQTEPSDRDDDLASLLISWDEALAAGELPTWHATLGDSKEQPRLNKTIACIDLLRRLWPRRGDTSLNPDAVFLDKAEPAVQRIGQFEIRRELGRGGFGIVFLARDTQLGRDVALKVPRADVLVTPELRARFQQEARAAAGLDHPNLVPIYEAGEVGPVCYIASAYCPGVTLAHWLQQQSQPAPLRDAAQLAQILAEAVQHAHARGIIHRDLKPANVLLTFSREPTARALPALAVDSRLNNAIPKITDFGLAKLLDGQAQQTQSGNLLGTPTYMAPEQAEGRRVQIGPAADVYALGVILYELVTGRPPFQADSGLATLLLVRKEEPVPPSRLRPKVPRDLETICLKCLEKDPRKRYAAAQDLADDLRRFLNAEPILARPVGPLGRLGKWVRRRPATAALLSVSALAAVSLVSVLVVSDVQIRHKQKQTETALKDAIEARNNLAESLDRERRTQYFYRIRLAYTSWQDANVRQAEEFLNSCRPLSGQTDLRGWEWHYLKRLCNPEPYSLRTGLPNTVQAIALRPDGMRMAMVQSDKTLTIRELPSGEVVLSKGVNPAAPLSSRLAYSPDGTLLALAGQRESSLRILAADDGRELHKLRGDNVAFSPDGQFLAAVDFQEGIIRVYDPHKGVQLRYRRLPLAGTCAFSFRPDGLCAAFTNKKDRRIVEIWNVHVGEKLLDLRKHATSVFAMAFSPDGSRLALACADGTVKIWKVPEGEEVTSLPQQPATIDNVVFSPDGSHIAVGTTLGSLKIWDMKGHEVRTLRGHLRSIHSLAFSSDGRWLGSAGTERTTLWDLTKNPEDLSLSGHTIYCSALAFSPDGQNLASVGGEGNVKVWEPATGKLALDLAGKTGGLWHVAYTAEGQLLACDAAGNTGKMWDAAGQEMHTIAFPKEPPHRGGAVSPAAKCIASINRDDNINLWEWKTGRLLHTLRGHKSRIQGVAFSPDGKVLASGSSDQTVKLWETASGRELFTLPYVGSAVHSIAFSWNSRLVAAGGDDKWIRIWDVETGHEKLQIENRFGRNAVFALAFSPDGKRLASAGFEPTVTLWDVETGEEVIALRSRRMGIGALAFSPDGRYLAAASNDATVTVWDGSLMQP